MNGNQSNTPNDQGSTEHVDEKLGAGSATIPADTPRVWSALELNSPANEEATLRVSAHWFDDEDPHVDLTAYAETYALDLSMSTSRARELADVLFAAADRATQGDRELGGEER